MTKHHAQIAKRMAKFTGAITEKDPLDVIISLLAKIYMIGVIKPKSLPHIKIGKVEVYQG